MTTKEKKKKCKREKDMQRKEKKITTMRMRVC